MMMVPGCSAVAKATALRRLGPIAGSGGADRASAVPWTDRATIAPSAQAPASLGMIRCLFGSVIEPLFEHLLQILVEARATVHLGGQDGPVQRIREKRVVERHRLDVRRLEDLLQLAAGEVVPEPFALMLV